MAMSQDQMGLPRHGTVQGERKRGIHKKRGEDNIIEWIGLRLIDTLREAKDR